VQSLHKQKKNNPTSLIGKHNFNPAIPAPRITMLAGPGFMFHVLLAVGSVWEQISCFTTAI
jgi:hypothetical protein